MKIINILATLVLLTGMSAAKAELLESELIEVYTASDNPNQQRFECHPDRVLIGIEVKYGFNGIGTVRGHCREWAPESAAMPETGVWSGTGLMTEWSTVSNPDDLRRHDALYCPENHAVAGIQGRLDADNFRAVTLLCSELTHWGGVSTEMHYADGYVGTTGAIEDAMTVCPTNLPARGLVARSTNALQGTRLLCGAAEPAASHPQEYTIDAEEMSWMVDLARRNLGLDFECVLSPDSDRGTGCRIVKDDVHQVVLLEVYVPGNMTWGTVVNPAPTPQARGEFRFFLAGNGSLQSGALAEGWSIDSLEITEYQDSRWCNIEVSSAVTADTPYSAIRFQCPNGDAEHYTFRYYIKRMTLIGPDGQNWEQAFGN